MEVKKNEEKKLERQSRCEIMVYLLHISILMECLQMTVTKTLLNTYKCL
jgi:hypothetical protein